MIILGIESSCDESAAALLKNGKTILSSVVASQIPIHREYGGVVPELASREHAMNLPIVVDACFQEASRSGNSVSWKDLTAIAATRGPGLMGALLVGLSYAKSAAYALGIPFLGVNHLEGHLASVILDHPDVEFPALALVVSGGHTNLYYVRAEGHYELMVRTLDDAAGEAFDKLARQLGLGYPGGPIIDRLAERGRPGEIEFPLPRIKGGRVGFSFSGLKTAALRFVQSHGIQKVDPELGLDEGANIDRVPQIVLDLLHAYQTAVIDQLLRELDRGLRDREVRSLQFSGGVSCNSELRRRSEEHFANRGLPVYYPRPELTTDNAVMIASAATRRVRSGQSDPFDLPADPNLQVR